MAQPVMQKSFNSGEWAPTLNARVDLQKYHSGAALLQNFFVDYRGGASTRPGTKYILQAYKSSTAVRLIPFQASFTVGYVLEFGDYYVRFYYNGAPVLESAITGGTNAAGNTFTIANTLSVGDWVYASGWGGMTNVNGRYFVVATQAAGNITVTGLRGEAITFTGTYTTGGQLQRVYTLTTPYAATDLAKLKYAQNVSSLYICHPNYQPSVLTLISSNNWTFTTIVFGSTVGVPSGVGVTTTLGAGSVNYAYIVTAVDTNGQESGPSAPATLASKLDLRTTAGTNTITWTAVPGALSYNIYKAELSYSAAVAGGAPYGFVGNCTGVTFADSNIAPDFSLTPPITKNPFQGAGVQSYAVTIQGTYATVPSVTIGAPPAGGVQATAQASLGVISSSVAAPGNSYSVGQYVNLVDGAGPSGGTNYLATIRVDSLAGFGVATYTVIWQGALTSGAAPATLKDPVPGIGAEVVLNVTWGVLAVNGISPGAGYTSAPSVTFSAGAAAATSTLATSSAGNPSAISIFQQRLVLAAPQGALQTFYMSQPGAFYNYNVSNPTQPDDAITGSITAGQLNEIKSMVSVPTGLMMLTSQANWLVNSGSGNSGVTPVDLTASAHSYVGASDVPPIVANFDILYVQAKGSVVRDLSYNFYANIFTGTDISVISSHLFYGYTVTEWTWAEEPYKVVWAIRSDGTLLSLTFLKEQEFIGWAHSVTNGYFKSTASIVESTASGNVDAVYAVVQRTVGGSTVKYIERFAERLFANGVIDAWCVDAGLQYSGAPATSFSGGEHLAGMSCTGLADGVIILTFTMPASGNFTLGTAASKVTVGLAYTCKLQTLALDIGEPTVQGKVKKITGVTVRVAETLGLEIGQDFTHLVPMKDLVRGNVSGMLTGLSSQTVTDLVTGDAYTMINPSWNVPGQYCIQQSNPYPASILGVIPEIVIGDTPK